MVSPTGSGTLRHQALLSFDTRAVGEWLAEHSTEAWIFIDSSESEWMLAWNGPPIPSELLTFGA